MKIKLKHFLTKYTPTKRGVISLVLAGIVILEGGWLLWGVQNGQTLSIQAYADQVISRCTTASYKPTCYEEEIPKTMDHISMEDAFQVTSLVQGQDPSYTYCHVLGHKLSARETAKNPSKWEEVIPRCPSGLCSNGCVHGAFQERFRKESFDNGEIEQYKPTFANICEAKSNWSPTGLEQATCYHALGHLLMYVTQADIPESISLCKELTIKKDGRNFSQLCFDGTFMQIFQPLEPDDFALIKGKEVTKDKVDTFCDPYTGAIQGSCRSESWPLYRAEFKDPKYVATFCSYLKFGDQRDRCVTAIMYVLTAQANFDENKLVMFCDGMTGGYKDRCYANAASRMLETDYRNVSKSAHFCASAKEKGSRDACFSELLVYANYNFHPSAPEREVLCTALAEPWRGQCRSGGERMRTSAPSIQH